MTTNLLDLRASQRSVDDMPRCGPRQCWSRVIGRNPNRPTHAVPPIADYVVVPIKAARAAAKCLELSRDVNEAIARTNPQPHH
jgi:hypothetical protein